MDRIQLAATLLQLTGNLVPASGSSPEQLSQLRRDLTQVLQYQPLSEMLPPTPLDLQSMLSREPFTTSEVAASIGALVDAEPTPQVPASEVRVFRREVPVLTSQNPASVPTWAAGQSISSTLGPFADTFGRLYWFDFYRFRRQVKVARGNAAVVFLSIPVRGPLAAQHTYALDTGSVWFVSTLLASSAPSGAYTGLKIKQGSWQVNGPVSISGDTIVIDTHSTCTLELELDQPQAPSALDTTTGDDAKAMTISLPRKATLECTPDGIALNHADAMALNVYGQGYTFEGASPTGTFEPIINRVLIPYTASPTAVTIAQVHSHLFEPGSSAPLVQSAWALPLTLTASINNLGDAAGIGAICLVADAGLTATWQGLTRKMAKLRQCYVLAEPGRVAVTAVQASVRGGRQHFELWDENNPTRKIRVQANITYAAEVAIRYNSLSTGNEIVMFAEVKSTFTIDRPLRADRQRPSVWSDKTEMALVEAKSVRQVVIQAWNIIQRLVINQLKAELAPIPFALSNALIKTTPIDDVVFVGTLDNETQIGRGLLGLLAHIYDLTPSLPDPYVSSYRMPVPQGPSQDPARGAADPKVPTSDTGVSLLTLIRWPAPDKPLMTFVFVDDSLVLHPPLATPSATAATSGKTAATAASHLIRTVATNLANSTPASSEGSSLASSPQSHGAYATADTQAAGRGAEVAPAVAQRAEAREALERWLQVAEARGGVKAQAPSNQIQGEYTAAQRRVASARARARIWLVLAMLAAVAALIALLLGTANPVLWPVAVAAAIVAALFFFQSRRAQRKARALVPELERTPATLQAATQDHRDTRERAAMEAALARIGMNAPPDAATGRTMLAQLGSDVSPTAGEHSQVYEVPEQPELRMSEAVLAHNEAVLARNEVAHEDRANAQKLSSYFTEAVGASRAQLYMLDVSTNADLLGVGVHVFARTEQRTYAAGPTTRNSIPFEIIGVDLSILAANTQLYALPQVQWEPIRTVQNPEVRPYPFPSPATSPDTGDPAVLAMDVYEMIPIAPKPVLKKLIAAYNDATSPARVAGLFTLPFGMKAGALWDNAHDSSRPGASISLNQPKFAAANVEGGLQISVLATSPDVGDAFETAGFKGATIQTRNLIDLLTGAIVLDDNGNPLSVLGPVVDTIFNNEFKPGGASPRVPVHRIDLSGYGATLFSNWLNPNAEIAATSQTLFDVWIGRTSHEIVQVKSILYPWGVPVVRTITIQRTSGGGVTRFDSGWRAQGPGTYDFSYYVVSGGTKTQVPNPFEFHPGVVKGIENVTHIADTGRIYHKPGAVPADDVTMQEVFFDADAQIDDVSIGASDGRVPSKKQRGYVQLAPYQRPLSPQQFYQLLQEEGPLGGPIDCVLNVGQSGQPMRVIRIDVSGVENSGAYRFVSAGRGSLHLPREGSWSLVKRQTSTSEIVGIDDLGALPLIREGQLHTATTHTYRFADPHDLLRESTPDADYGLLHSTGSQKVLYLRPTIARNDASIRSTLHPYFADSYAILGSTAIFPNVDATFPLGASGTALAVLGPGQLRLTSGGTFTAPAGYQRDLLNSGGSRIYIAYSDVADSGNPTIVNYTFDSLAPTPWTANLKKESVIIDIMTFTGLVTVTSEFDAAFGKAPEMPSPKVKFGSILQPIVDILKFLGDFDMSKALAVSMGNATVTTWQPKWKASLYGFKLKFEAPLKLEIWVFGAKIKAVPQLPGVVNPPIKAEVELEVEGHYNMLPFSTSSDDPSTDLSTVATDMLSIGASLKLGGELDILCTTIGAAGLYAVGLVEFEFGIDSKEGKSFGFKVAVGAELAANWPVVGDVSVMLALGLEMEWKASSSSTSSGIYALMIFKGEAELLDGVIDICIHIEAKGGTEKEIESGTGTEKDYAICEVEFAAEVSLAFVIHFEFDVTWQEKREVS
jgi:hypothetical protein